jgi:two-component system alkaline phosphatase synthesis response regulator PhoP
MDNPKKTILIIDDEKNLSRILELQLTELGYKVIIAMDGKEGLIKAKEERVDLIILDLMLPKLPGEEVCRQIRKDECIGKTPIIMLTAKTQDVDRVIGRVIGANCYLTKPFDWIVLIEQVKKLIQEVEDGK